MKKVKINQISNTNISEIDGKFIHQKRLLYIENFQGIPLAEKTI